VTAVRHRGRAGDVAASEARNAVRGRVFLRKGRLVRRAAEGAVQPDQHDGQPRQHERGLLRVRVVDAEGAVELDHCGAGEKEQRHTDEMMPPPDHRYYYYPYHRDDADGGGASMDEEEVAGVACIYTQVLCVGMMWWFGLK